MAHFLEYKSANQVLPFEVDFTDLLTDQDTQLDLVKCQEALTVTNSAGEDKKSYLVQEMIIEGLTKLMTLVLVNGLNGEDYLISVVGIGDVSFKTKRPVRLLELRVRNTLLGNL